MIFGARRCCRGVRAAFFLPFLFVFVVFVFLFLLLLFFFFWTHRATARLNRSAFLDATVFASKESFANFVRKATTIASESPSSPPSCKNVPRWCAHNFCACWTNRPSVRASHVDIDVRSDTCMNTIATVSSRTVVQNSASPCIFVIIGVFLPSVIICFFFSRRKSPFLSGLSPSSASFLGFAFRASLAKFSQASPNITLSYRP